MKHCLTLDLKNNKNTIAEYEKWHSPNKIWKEIPEGIRQVGIQQMEIYRWENRLFMIIETADNFIWDEQMQKLSTLPKQKEWELLMDAYQQKLTDNEKWQPMKNIFKLSHCI